MLSSRNLFKLSSIRWFSAGRRLESGRAVADNLSPKEKTDSEPTVEKSEQTDATQLPSGKNQRLYQPVSLEVSQNYLHSKAYQVTYGDTAVWVPYRRNHKGHIPPSRTRETCVRKDRIVTGNPCPICRDEYLLVHPQNVKLIKQFISPHTGAIYSYQITGVCQLQHKRLLVAFEQAQDMGLIKIPLPYRTYNYVDFYDLPKSEGGQQSKETLQ